MYRSRPKDSLDNEVLRFLSSINDDQSILYYDIIESQAHSIMLYETGNITAMELKGILSALEEAKINSELISNSGYEDIHEAIEAFVIEKAGQKVGGKIQTARSRNDQVVTDLRMKTRDDINKICEALASLIGIIIERAKENKDVPMPLYTHLQQAQIGTFSHLMLSYCYALMRDMERLYQSYGRINQSPLGASAIGGSSINIDRKRTAALLGFDSVIMNSIDATSTRDAFLEYAATLSILMTTLGRVAEDFIIWSTVEFGFIELADRYSSTSSAMPQKKNPDPLELIRAKVAITTGNFVTLLGIVKSIPSGYSRDLQEFKPPLLNSSTTVLASLKLMKGVTETLVINRKKMMESANRSYAVALDVAEQLVSRCNLTFRNAHRVVGALVQRAVEMNNTPLMLLKPADVESAVKSLELGVKTEILVGIIKELTPNKSLELRKTLGSPSPTEHDEMIRSLSQGVSNYSTGITKRTRLVKETFDALHRLVQQYLQT